MSNHYGSGYQPLSWRRPRINVPDCFGPEKKDGKLHVFVKNALANGWMWPSTALFEGEYFEWESNDAIPSHLASSVFGHGVYKSMGAPGSVFIDIDAHNLLDFDYTDAA